jgi:hypothetical protein
MTITVEDHATPGLRAMMARLADRTALHAEMGMGVERLVARHMRTTKVPQGNRLGGTSTGFWMKAIASIKGTSDGNSATVSIPARGVALQYYGGTVRPKAGKKYLTIPACPEAHGKRASEIKGGYEQQEWLRTPYGRPFAIAEKIKVNRKGIQTRGRILFWLKKSVTIRAHSDVLPEEAAIGAEAAKAAKKYIARVFPKT